MSHDSRGWGRTVRLHSQNSETRNVPSMTVFHESRTFADARNPTQRD